MRKKAPPILCTEVVPGKLYMAPRRDARGLSYYPVIVQCTPEPGWLRGFVDVHVNNSLYSSKITGSVTVRFIDDNKEAHIPVCRGLQEDDPWMFAVGKEKWEPTTLREMPQNWFDEQAHAINLQLNEHIRKIGELEDARAALRLLQKQHQSE